MWKQVEPHASVTRNISKNIVIIWNDCLLIQAINLKEKSVCFSWCCYSCIYKNLICYSNQFGVEKYHGQPFLKYRKNAIIPSWLAMFVSTADRLLLSLTVERELGVYLECFPSMEAEAIPVQLVWFPPATFW